ncbi:MAG TPA: LuxR C-terminal-related transcriptional regulator, partial [Acidimicrobiia bacterium]|nr:LuxR C-terminal-related transcriptional regulator [Acidimicrobiia bacterium]
VEAGLIVQDDEGPEVVYRLAHPLIQEVAAAELPAVAGRRLHSRLVEAVEKLRPNDLDRLAYHYWRAGNEVDRERALAVLLEAGERARSLAAHDEAARHFGAALPLIRDGQRPELLAQVLEQLGASWEPLGETAAAIEVWEEGVGELERRGDQHGVARLRRRLAFAAQASGDITGVRRHIAAGINALQGLPVSDELFELHAARLIVDPPFGDLDRVRQDAAELMQLAERVGTPRARMEGLLSGVMVAYIGGERVIDLRIARAKGEEGLRVAEEAGEWLLVRRAHRELAWLALYDYNHAVMRVHAQAQIDLNRRLGDFANQPAALLQLAYAAMLSGDFDESLSVGEEGAAGARRYDRPRTLAMCLGQMGIVRAYRGELDAAAENLAEAAQVFPQLWTDPRGRYVIGWPQAIVAFERGDLAEVHNGCEGIGMPGARILVGTAHLLVGDIERAASMQALLAADEPSDSCPAAFADRLQGLIEQARGEPEAAGELLERSAAVLDRLDLPFEAAVSRFHAGTVDSVRQALATFERMGAARYAEKSRRTLRSLGVRLPSPRTGRRADQPLSRREMEVSRLVADGLTNAEIAERLVLSVRTVESHLDHVYARLGISSRAALARWVTAGEAASAP